MENFLGGCRPWAFAEEIGRLPRGSRMRGCSVQGPWRQGQARYLQKLQEFEAKCRSSEPTCRVSARQILRVRNCSGRRWSSQRRCGGGAAGEWQVIRPSQRTEEEFPALAGVEGGGRGVALADDDWKGRKARCSDGDAEICLCRILRKQNSARRIVGAPRKRAAGPSSCGRGRGSGEGGSSSEGSGVAGVAGRDRSSFREEEKNRAGGRRRGGADGRGVPNKRGGREKGGERLRDYGTLPKLRNFSDFKFTKKQT